MLTRGPLPGSVYWRRRLVALSVAVALVVVIAKLLGHGSGGSAAVQVAQNGPASAAVGTSTAPAPSLSASTPAVPRPTRTAPASTAPTSAPAVPAGDCQPADVVITPSVSEAAVGEPVTIDLAVRTRTEPACYWRMSASTLQVKVAARDGLVWSTVDCHQAIHAQELTLTNTASARATLTWAGHSSDRTCSSHAPWATEGSYTVTAVALGGTPSSATFQLGAPTVVVTVTPKPLTTLGPTASATASPKASGTASSGKASGKASSKASGKPSRHSSPPAG